MKKTSLFVAFMVLAAQSFAQTLYIKNGPYTSSISVQVFGHDDGTYYPACSSMFSNNFTVSPPGETFSSIADLNYYGTYGAYWQPCCTTAGSVFGTGAGWDHAIVTVGTCAPISIGNLSACTSLVTSVPLPCLPGYTLEWGEDMYGNVEIGITN